MGEIPPSGSSLSRLVRVSTARPGLTIAASLVSALVVLPVLLRLFVPVASERRQALPAPG